MTATRRRDRSTWELERHVGTAEQLHHLDLAPDRRSVVVLEVTRPALVLGSTQSEDSIDLGAVERAGLDLARRRSGGGAVLLLPGEHVWVDVVLPRADPLWHDDVGISSWWLGDSFAAALAEPPLADPPRADAGPAVVAEVHREGVTDRDLGRLVCFAAVGPGEVSVDGAKLVGLSQRRTRHGARFQCIVHRRWDPAASVALIAERRDELATALAGRVSSLDLLGVEAGWSVVEGLLTQLP